jgi:5-methylcytosine-specific restriction endonuclease McrA
MKTYECINCRKESLFQHSKSNKYCGPVCMHEYRYNHIKKLQIEEGKLTKTSLPLLIRYVSERDGYKCSCCGLTNWLGEKISLDLDHIDGNNTNNFPSNLRLLCPNCHRQTPTWGNKKR